MDIQGYWCIFTHTHSRANRVKESPLTFLKIEKSALILREKKDPDCVHLWVKFSIKNAVLRVSRRKNSQNVSLWGLFKMFLRKCLAKYPSSTTLLLLWKFWLHACTQALFFLQNAQSLMFVSVMIRLPCCANKGFLVVMLSFKPLSHTEDMLKINWDLRGSY